MPIGILLFVALLLIRDTLNESGMFANLHAKLKVLYRRWLRRRAKKRLRREARERAEMQEFLNDVKNVARFVFGAADFAQGFYYSQTVPEYRPLTKKERKKLQDTGELASDEKVSEIAKDIEERAQKSLLQQAIEREDYETAAKIRDQIKGQ